MLSPTSRFNEDRVAFEDSWADSSKSAGSSIAFERLSLLCACLWHRLSSRWEGACREHGSVSPANLHPTGLTLGTAHMFLICVCVLLALHFLPRCPPALDRVVVPLSVHMLWCQRSLCSLHRVPGHCTVIFFLRSMLEQLPQAEPHTCMCTHTRAQPCSIARGQHQLLAWP